MKVTAIQNINKRKKADYLIIPFLEGKTGPIALCDTKKFNQYIKGPIHSKDFIGKENQLSYVYDSKDTRILLLGLGKADKINEFHISEVYAEAVAFLKKQKASSVNILVPQKLTIAKDDLIKGIVEALFLANYNFDKLKHFTKKDSVGALKSATLIGIDKNQLDIITKGRIIAEGVNLTRDLINNNADDKAPEKLALIAKSLEESCKNLSVTILNKKNIEDEKMGLLLAVNKGSDKDPSFTILDYIGDPNSKDRTVIIGKGIIYDTGGLSLKPSTGMDTMKADMSGGAAILGTMFVISHLNLKVNVTGLIPATENAIGPASYKPGDVYVSMSNKTVEVKNTDAEGRLILADALTYAVKKIKPNRIIDLATLTGSIVVALGEEIAGLFSNSQKLSSQLEIASKKTGDKLWQMPLFEPYKKELKSEIADLKNCSDSRNAGSIVAALFLQEFVEDFEWAHIDIAGPAFKSKPKAIQPTCASGVGVRLLTYFFENLAK